MTRFINLLIIIMLFLTITDPTKRDYLVQDYLKTQDNIRKNYITERTGEL